MGQAMGPWARESAFIEAAGGMASDYVPIACVEHERLEFAVLRRQRLRLEYRDEGGLTISRFSCCPRMWRPGMARSG
jgi:hypothetical protein